MSNTEDVLNAGMLLVSELDFKAGDGTNDTLLGDFDTKTSDPHILSMIEQFSAVLNYSKVVKSVCYICEDDSSAIKQFEISGSGESKKDLLTTEDKRMFDKVLKSLTEPDVRKKWLSKYNKITATFFTSGSECKVELKFSKVNL
ncbi:hypothetical protein [Companilactobacillus nantensis]|uniref:Uncharacterized protein n=1 Tax=Companilactobacillus nantensis DSM 16982 TaxID=1423774 RepID=A0A0R1WEI4_9LACO|nr:hypothetical protein [Companilactobacillus nantensis]KRM15925.1 hypothetical protein FD31_GL000820 [Companilactobacillus nantensis DSM 16982]GEO64788.1 hypothetical protein LNA01_19710 [Companilactobacillus nantensis]